MNPPEKEPQYQCGGDGKDFMEEREWELLAPLFMAEIFNKQLKGDRHDRRFFIRTRGDTQTV